MESARLAGREPVEGNQSLVRCKLVIARGFHYESPHLTCELFEGCKSPPAHMSQAIVFDPAPCQDEPAIFLLSQKNDAVPLPEIEVGIDLGAYARSGRGKRGVIHEDGDLELQATITSKGATHPRMM